MDRKTERFRKDHEGILNLVEKLSGALDVASLKSNPASTCMILAKMSGRLKVHLTTEDRTLYPNLINSPDPDVRKVAERFFNEMGNIKEVVDKYLEKWISPNSLKANPERFIDETKRLIDALKNRIQRENDELYEIADQAA